MADLSKVSPAKMTEVLNQLQRAHGQIAKFKEKGETQAGVVLSGLTIVGTEFGLGYARGRYGKVEAGGIPVEIIGGALGELLAFTGIAGRQSEHIHNMSHAALAFGVACEAMQMGEEARARAEATKPGQLTNGHRVVETPAPVQSAPMVASGIPQTRPRRVIQETRHIPTDEQAVEQLVEEVTRKPAQGG